jgi:carbon monoxide dehydrogenase subunit G
VASFSHTVDIPRPPADVFPWLLDADKVPQWTGHLERYERIDDGAFAAGSKVRQILEISGRRIDVQLDVTAYDPPNGAETRFESNGVVVTSHYRLEPNGAGTRLTQAIDADPTSLSGRMIVPLVQPRLEQKLTEDLERLREALSG